MMRDYFNTLARYHLWATDKILQQIATINEADYRKDCGLFFKSIHGTLNHMLVGDLHWYARFSGAPALSLALNTEVETDRPALDARLRDAVQPWQQFLSEMPPQRYDSLLYYKRADGVAVSSPFTATLGHDF
ncbi:DinB family protein [Glaciimonas soli]|uniref:DinB family protein n=1 Tax=Glaciimonas soli TaxID=2590999 RepID=UPI002240E8D5|nr:DinB family protein [Glaciimonas soli]